MLCGFYLAYNVPTKQDTEALSCLLLLEFEQLKSWIIATFVLYWNISLVGHLIYLQSAVFTTAGLSFKFFYKTCHFEYCDFHFILDESVFFLSAADPQLFCWWLTVFFYSHRVTEWPHCNTCLSESNFLPCFLQIFLNLWRNMPSR